MENDNSFKKKDYIRNLLLLHLELKKINQLKTEPIKDINNTFYCYLINKDIIDNYLDNQISEYIANYVKNNKVDFSNYANTNNYINTINNELNKKFDFNQIKIKNLYLDLLLTEHLKISDVEYPFNFFIIEKDCLMLLFNNKSIFELSDFKAYEVLIGTEGIFIINQDPKTNKLIVYYLDDFNRKEFRINKIFIFKNGKDFQNEFNKIQEKGIYEYFKIRNIQINENGKFNLIDDGIIVGTYINIFRNTNFVDNEENNKRNENQEEENEENEEIEENDNNQIHSISQTKDVLIKIFLKNILICLSQIKDLKIRLNERFKDSNPNLLNKTKGKYSLIDKLHKFFSKYSQNNNINELQKELEEFTNEFKKKNLNDEVKLDRDSKFTFYENIIKVLINELYEETVMKNGQEGQETFEKKKNNSFIFSLFYGNRNKDDNQTEFEEFNTITIWFFYNRRNFFFFRELDTT